MEELLRQILEELQGQDSTAWWLEVLRINGPLVGGALVAAIGFFAVHQQNVTQRENMKLTTAAEADERRRARLTDWRHERYGQLLAALGEFQAALRRMTLVLGNKNASGGERRAAALHFIDVNHSGRILEAAMQLADKEVAELAQQLADNYYGASKQLVEMSIAAQLPKDEEALREAYLVAKKQIDDSNERAYDLNRRIEQLISEGD